jgi:peptidoglycan/xylan/chitin deacetylase (PgdA/CDA1 family)
MGNDEPSPVGRRIFLAAVGGVFLTTATAAIVTKHDGQAHAASADVRATRAAPDPKPPPSPGPTRHPEPTRHPKPATTPVDSAEYKTPMYYVNGGPKTVALTIDDGPSPIYTPELLAILHQYRVTAAFSMVGRNVAAYPEVAREVTDAGHMVVNHTWDHSDLATMTAVAVRTEIARATDAIHAATGKQPAMFRAPYGDWSPAVFRCCAQDQLRPLDWSVDPRDWAIPGVRSIVNTVLKTTQTGSIILEHDGGGNRSETVAALKIWLPRLLDEGYRFTTP